MRALRFEQFGEPASVLHVQEIERPIPGPDEALVEVHAAAVNPSDAKNVQGAMHTTLPRTPGRDFAGVVVEGAAEWSGQEVWGTGGDLGFTRDGTHAEYVVIPKAALARKPALSTLEEAGSVGVGYVTAWMGLVEAAKIAAGETVLVIGGTGAVGRAVGQIAKWKGCRVLATERSATEAEAGWNRAADVVINLEREDLVEVTKRATDGKGANVVFNAVGGPTFEPALNALATGGRQVVITTVGERRVSFDLLDFYRRELRLLGVNTLLLDVVACARVLEALRPGFEAGALSIRPVERYPLEEAVAAYERVLRGAPGKVVLLPKAR